MHSIPYGPQANIQAKSSKKTLINILRKLLEGAKGRLIDGLPKNDTQGLMGHKNDNQDRYWVSSFSHIYDTEVVIPSKIQEPTLCLEIMQKENNGPRKEDLLLTERRRENALIRIESHKRTV